MLKIGRGRDQDDVGEPKRIVNALLQLIDRLDSENIFVAATNYASSLDKAIWRRFDKIIIFEKPNLEIRVKLLQQKLGNFATKVDLKYLANLLDFASAADIETICQNAIKSVIIRDGKSIYNELLKEIDYYQVQAKIVASV